MISQSLSAFFVSLGSIIFVDLVLSGDNALVIGAALTGIPPRWRRLALIAGGAGAILARIVFTAFATFLLRINYLQAIGGVLVLYIACRLVLEEEDAAEDKEGAEDQTANKAEEESGTPKSFIKRVVTAPLLVANPSTLVSRLSKRNASSQRNRFIMTVITVIIADITMSLDNIVAIGALANGQLLILSLGLVISIIILLVSSTFVSLLIERMPGLILLAALILAWISGNLILHDVQKFPPVTSFSTMYATVIVYVLTFSVVVAAIVLRWFKRRRSVQVLISEDREAIDAARNK